MAMAVANRYARALSEVVAPAGNYRAVLADLENFLAAYQESRDLRDVMETPAVSLVQKVKVLEAILARIGAAEVSVNFLRVLVTNYRIGILGEICTAFLKIANERLGVVQVRVFSAATLSDAERQALRTHFEELTRKKVEMEFRMDGGLLGGILAQIESTVYDGSVRGQLQQLREQLTRK
ncbi:MAG TPA: ATP synthase F1 subunit delta [Terriglobia bacterium]|nr:ATP synthase F1 subunit delta [Terriglobia bacterium]